MLTTTRRNLTCLTIAAAIGLSWALPELAEAQRYRRKNLINSVKVERTARTKKLQAKPMKEQQPAISADEFIAIQGMVRNIRQEQVKQYELLIADTDPDDPELPDLLFRLAEIHAQQQRYWRFRGMEMYSKIDGAKSAGQKAALEKKQESYFAASKRVALARDQGLQESGRKSQLSRLPAHGHGAVFLRLHPAERQVRLGSSQGPEPPHQGLSRLQVHPRGLPGVRRLLLYTELTGQRRAVLRQGPAVPQIGCLQLRPLQEGLGLLEPRSSARRPRDVLRGRKSHAAQKRGKEPQPRRQEGLRSGLRRNRQAAKSLRRVQARRCQLCLRHAADPRRYLSRARQGSQGHLHLPRTDPDEGQAQERLRLAVQTSPTPCCRWARRNQKVKEIENLVKLYVAYRRQGHHPRGESVRVRRQRRGRQQRDGQALAQRGGQDPQQRNSGLCRQAVSALPQELPAVRRVRRDAVLLRRAHCGAGPKTRRTSAWPPSYGAGRGGVYRRRQVGQAQGQAPQRSGLRFRAGLEKRPRRGPAHPGRRR